MPLVARPSRVIRMLVCVIGLSSAGSSQPLDGKSCDDLLRPLRTVKGQKVGPQACRMNELAVEIDGRPFRRLDFGLDGTVEGYLPKTGQYINYFNSAPDLVFPAGSNPGPIYFGVARYSGARGSAMTIVYPEAGSWNRKVWVTVHGRGRSFKRGSLRAWNLNVDPKQPTADLNKYETLMLRKGYAVVKTYRTSDTLGGDVQVTLEDGTVYPERNLNDNAQYIVDFTILARAVIEKRLAALPSRTYFYGHSAGGRIGRSLNYTPGLNRDLSGSPVFDGILADDSATGLWLPVKMANGKDVLFQSDVERAAFVPQLEISHQMYNAESPGEKAPWISTNYLENKRQNARLLRDKGLSAKHRMYEVRRISHSGGDTLPDGRRGDTQILDLSRMMDRFIDMLDAWVDKGVAPPPTRSDWAELGDVNGDGETEYPGLAFPEVACPLGVYHQFPASSGPGGGGVTGFAPFSGEGLEPLDGRGVFIDMNANRVWDERETPTEAWRRLGLLGSGELLTAERYVACVSGAAERLRSDGFFSEQTARWYAATARTTRLQ
jgi:hypothetical protein